MADDRMQTLNDLIHLDNDAIEAYRQAIDACKVTEIRTQLTAFQADHERHVEELSAMVRALGGEPVRGRDVKGFLIGGFTAITAQGDRSALVAMRGNEELTTRRYAAARQANLGAEALALVERNHADEQRHLAWIQNALASRTWDKAA